MGTQREHVKTERICKGCSKKFLPLYQKQRKSYCEKSCYLKALSNRMIGNTVTLGHPGKNFYRIHAVEVKTTKDYRDLHKWWRRKFGKADHCDFCGAMGEGRIYQWAVINGHPDGDPMNWSQLCTKCHVPYDREFNGRIFDNGLRGSQGKDALGRFI